MAKLFYSMAGEGRGHATRVRTIVESLRSEHEVSLFASGAAFDLLEAAYADSEVRVHRIPGLFFHYTGRRLSIWKTTKAAIAYLARLPGLISSMERLVRSEQPDLVITDFEPSLARAARRAKVPFVSLDHQHFLVVNDLSSLPRTLRWKARFMGWVVGLYYSGQAKSIVSSFYFPPLRRGYEDVVQIGVLMRPGVIEARRRQGGNAEHGQHVVVYLRRFADPNVIEALANCGRDVRIYGLGEKPSEGRLSYHPVSEDGFLQDLATCDALISNAGNQLVGEALFLHKPCFVFPEAGNSEQSINAHFLREGGGGDWCDVGDVSAERLREFLSRLDEYRARIEPDRLNGNEVALDVIRQFLSNGAADPVAPRDSLETISA